MIMTMNKEEMNKLINALDFYSRIWIGQFDEILSNLRCVMDFQKLDQIETDCKDKLMRMRHLMFPELDSFGWHGSHGIFSPDIDFRAGAAYDLQQVFRYTLAYFLHSEGGITVDFRPPMFAESDPYPAPKAVCRREGEDVFVDIEVCPEQKELMDHALKIKEAELAGDIRTLFSYYTADEKVLVLADVLREKLMNVKRKG